jgi:hypothetical protein
MPTRPPIEVSAKTTRVSAASRSAAFGTRRGWALAPAISPGAAGGARKPNDQGFGVADTEPLTPDHLCCRVPAQRRGSTVCDTTHHVLYTS